MPDRKRFSVILLLSSEAVNPFRLTIRASLIEFKCMAKTNYQQCLLQVQEREERFQSSYGYL